MSEKIISFSFFFCIFTLIVSISNQIVPSPSITSFHSQIRKLQSAFNEFQINSDTMNEKGLPDVAIYANGFVVCWVGTTSSNSHVVYAQLYSFFGVSKSPQFQVNNLKNIPKRPKITGLSSGGFVIVWEELDKVNMSMQCYAQIFNSFGEKSGLTLIIGIENIYDVNSQPHVAGLKSGGFVVTWVYNFASIYVSYYLEDGTLGFLNAYYVSNTDYITDQKPTVASLYNGQFIIVFAYDSSTIYGVICSISSCLDPIPLVTGSKPYVVATLNGFLVVYINLNWNTFLYNTYGQLYDDSGNVIRYEINLHSTSDCSDDNPRASVLFDGCFILSLDCGSSPDIDIYELMFDPDGEFINGTYVANANTNLEQSSNSAAAFPNGNFIIIWDDIGADYWKIKARIFQIDSVPFKFLKNKLTIRQGENLLINRTMINSIGTGTITYSVTSNSYGYFTISNTTVYEFTQADIDNLKVFFIHDNSFNAPFYSLICSNDLGMSYSWTGNINFIIKPNFMSNFIIIEQFTKVVITSKNIEGMVFDGTTNFFYLVVSSVSCNFELASEPDVMISYFTAEQVSNLEVVFYAFDTPSYVLRLHDSSSYTDSDGLIDYYIGLQLTINKIIIRQGEHLIINDKMFALTYDYRILPLFLISTVQNGYFAYDSNINNDIYSFTNDELIGQKVFFIHDGSLRPPIIKITVTDGKRTTEAAYTDITFVSSLELTINSLQIQKGETLQITTKSIFGSSSGSSSAIIFTIFNIRHGSFTSYGQKVSQFSLQNILDYQIFFLHDGSDFAPSYEVSIGDGSARSDAIGALVSYNNHPPAPILKKNSFIINQGETITLSRENLEAKDGINADFTFIIINIELAYFAYNKNPEVPILSFKFSEILNSNVTFVHDGSTNTPRFNFSVLTLDGNTNAIEYSGAIYFNSKPVLLTNVLTIKRGEKKVINSNTLQATDVETSRNDLSFKIYNVMYGMFININDPAYAITSFNQYQVSNNEIFFFHDGTIKPPSYSVSVSDGSVTIESQKAIIDFLMTKGICGLKKLTHIDAELMRSIAITSDGLYIIASIYQGKLSIIDINDPEKPVLLKGSLDLIQYNVTKISGLVLKNNFIYLLSESATLAIIYVKDPKKPKFIGSLGRANISLDLAVCDNNYTYLAAETEGIYIISTENTNENQSKANFISSFSLGVSSISALACFGNVLYLVTNDAKPVMIVLNISNPTYPKYINNVSLSSIGNYIKINTKGTLTFIGTNKGIDIFDLSNISNIANITTITLSFEVFSLDISDNDEYLTVLGDLTMITINIQLLYTKQYAILDILNYEFGLNQVLFLPNSHYGFIASVEGLQIFNIFRGLQSRLSPQLSSYYPNYINATGNSHVVVSSDSSYYFLLTMINGWEHLVLKNAKDFDNFNTTLKEVNLTCNNMQSSSIVFPQKDTKTVYVTNCGNLTTVAINPTNHNLTKVKSTIRIGDAWGLAIAPNEDYLYVTNNKTNQMHIVSIGKNTSVKANISLNGVPKMISVSIDNKFVFVVLEKTGIAIINVTNKSDPKTLNISDTIRYLGDVRSMIYFTDLYGNQYIVVTLYFEGMIKIIDVNNASFPIVLSKRYIGKQTAGIGLFPNKNFIVVQSHHRLSIVEIRNLTNPVIVNDIQSEAIGYSYQIGVLDSAIFMPTFQIFNLYYGDTFFYPYVSTITNALGQKIFLIQLFSVSPKTFDKTQEKIKLLMVETEESWPFWMTMDYETNILTITPPAMESLNILRKIKLTFGTQISEAEFLKVSPSTTSAYSQLLFENYIDANSIPTIQYDPNIPLNFKNDTFNSTVIEELLNKHMHFHYATFYMNDFVSLDTAPINGEVSLQTQFDNYPSPKIDLRIDLQFDQFSFTDPDGDLLTYHAVGLPSFLQFNSASFKIYGTPTKKDLGVYAVTIIASDGYKNITQKFTISVKNIPPTCISPGNQEFILGNTFDWQLPPTTFVDADGDKLTYTIKMINEITGQEENAPNWLNLDSTRLRVYGKPEAKDIKMDIANQRFYENFILRLNATDIADQTVSFNLNLTVKNYFPIYNPNLTLSMQFKNKYGSYLKIQQTLDFEFSTHTFLDPENSPLIYTVTGLPHWLTFTAASLYGTTSKADIGDYTLNITASDGYYNAVGSFLISVQNHPPKAYPLSDKNLVFGHSLNHSFYPLLSFSDPDGDPLIYKAYLFENNALTVLPSWIDFKTDDVLSFSGTPTVDFIPYNETERRYYQAYQIVVMAIDLGDANASSSFNLIVKNNMPLKNKLLSNQFANYVPTVQVDSDITFSEDTFIDENNDTLTYEARLVNDDNGWWRPGRRLAEADDTDLLPGWIIFDDKSRKFSLSPTSDHFLHTYTIKVICRNSMLEDSDNFTFEVGMSAIYAFNIFLIVLGAVGSALGFYAYRIRFYSVMGKHLYCYPDYVKVYVNEKYQKNIYLIKEDLDICILIWKQIKKNHKDVTTIYNSSEKEQTLTNYINEAANQLKTLKKLSDHTEYDNLRSSEIFECFLVLDTIENYKFANKIFNQTKKLLQKRKLRLWYDEFVSISPPLYEYNLDKPFPAIEINFAQFQLVLNEVIKTNKKGYKIYEEIPEMEQKLLQGKLKACVLGIPSPFSKLDKFLEYSRGESLWIDCNEIAEIQYEKNNSDDEFVHSSIFDYPERNNYNSITNWLKYDIHRGMLVFSGEPAFADIGKHIVRIFNNEDMVVREFGVEVLQGKSVEINEVKTALMGVFSEPVSREKSIKEIEMETKKVVQFNNENFDLEIQGKNEEKMLFTKVGVVFDNENEEDKKLRRLEILKRIQNLRKK